MAAPGYCPDCGSKQPANAPQGLCPHCLLHLGLGAGVFRGPTVDADSEQTADLTAGLRSRSGRSAANGSGDPPASGILRDLDRSIGPVPARLAARRPGRCAARAAPVA